MGGQSSEGTTLTLVLDSGGVTSLAYDRARLAELHRRGEWPPLVPSVVLTECLTGDHRRDHAVNRLVGLCELIDVDESLARDAAQLRTAVARGSRISAVDAVVAATARAVAHSVVITSDPRHLRALAAAADGAFAVVSA